jgi:metallo-beta-lactamase family protein
MNTSKNISVHFLGAAGTVTGSKYLVDTGEQKVMVDCGLFQGLKELREKNWDYLDIDASEVDAVILTHGHLDHTGFLPRLVKMGFKGKIIGTSPTLEIARIILRDSAKIQEEEATRANKEGYSKHHPAKPLYTIKEAEGAITQFKSVPEGESIEILPNTFANFQYNGHIIGSTYIELKIASKMLVFSGDVGRKEDFLMRSPKKPNQADCLFVESTYGDRLHPKEDVYTKLKSIIRKTIQKGGSVVVPSFAVERTQTLMFLLWQLKKNNEIPDIPMIMDSPMGANVLSVFQNYKDWHKLPAQDCYAMCNAFRIVKEYKETWEVINSNTPKIIVAGSGMVTGGRVLTYLKYLIDKSETTLVLVGFQADGTRGRKLLDGEKEIKIYGKFFPVNAEVENIEVLSSHADQEELIHWMSDIRKAPKNVFIVHGEPESSATLKDKIKSAYGWNVVVPRLYDIVEI